MPADEAIAWNEGGWRLADVGDLDGNGSPDVALTPSIIGYDLFEGPLTGFVNDLPAPESLAEEIGLTSNVRHPLGDLDGDGITELLVLYYEPGSVDTGAAEWIVLFSPYDEPEPQPRGVKIADYLDLYHSYYGEDWVVADLDGDGLVDLLNTDRSFEYQNPPPELVEAGELTIWYAADIVAAYHAALAR